MRRGSRRRLTRHARTLRATRAFGVGFVEKSMRCVPQQYPASCQLTLPQLLEDMLTADTEDVTVTKLVNFY